MHFSKNCMHAPYTVMTDGRKAKQSEIEEVFPEYFSQSISEVPSTLLSKYPNFVFGFHVSIWLIKYVEYQKAPKILA